MDAGINFLKKIRKNPARICGFIFVALSLLHYFSQRPLWLDEVSIYKNLQTYRFTELFTQLLNVQIFPRVHLIMVQAFALPFGYHVLALRFFSLVFMFAAFFLWAKLYKQSSNSDALIFLSLFAIATSYRFTYYAAELKPYSMDVLTIALYALVFCYQKSLDGKSPTAATYALALAMPLLIFFSYAGLFVFWIVGFNFFLLSLKDKKFLAAGIVNTVMCMICLVVFYLIDLRYSVGLSAAQDYWHSYFLCTKSAGCFFNTFGEGIKKLATFWYGGNKPFVKAAVIFIPFFVFSLFVHGAGRWKTDGFGIFHIESLGLVLFLELMLFGFLQKYPFTGDRTSLFFAPFVIYLTVKGMDSLRKKNFLGGLFLVYYGLYCLVCLVNTFIIHWKLYFPS